jgi:hypothetical protein
VIDVRVGSSPSVGLNVTGLVVFGGVGNRKFVRQGEGAVGNCVENGPSGAVSGKHGDSRGRVGAG